MVNKLTMAGLGAMVLSVTLIVVLYGIVPVIGYQIESAITLPTDTQAVNRLVFSGNVTTGELVNITAEGVVYAFEFNTTGTGTSDPVFINVDVSSAANTSILASGELTDAINGNATLAALITAVNTTNQTTVTAVAAGETANGYTTTETCANAAWGTATFECGVTGTQWDDSTNTDIPTGYNLWTTLGGFITLSALMLFITGFIATLKGIRS